MIPYTFHAEAEAEFTASVRVYDTESPDVRARFVAAVEQSISLIREYPDVGSPVGRSERRVLIPRFPYQLVYRFNGQSILVVAIAHSHRRPNYWHGRE